MQAPADLIGVLADVFQWVGFAGAVLFAVIALVLVLADGTWLPARGVVEPVEGGRIVRWIDDDGGVNEAALSAHDLARIGDRDMADLFYRRGWHNRMRLTRGSPLVRLVVWLAVGLAALGVLALAASLVLVAVQG